MRRNYTALDMIRISRLSKEVTLKPIDLIKEYDKRYPEKSNEEKLRNLLKALNEEEE